MPDLLPPLTPDGQRVLTNANHIAKQHSATGIDSEMLLLALLQLTGCQAEQTLQTSGLRVENLITRLAASIKMTARQAQPHSEMEQVQAGRFTLSLEARDGLSAAWDESQHHGLDVIDTRLLVLGMLRCAHSKAGQFLTQYGLTLGNFRTAARLMEVPVTNLPRFAKPKLSMDGLFFGLSPLFIGLVLFTILSAYLTYSGLGNPKGFMFFFVIGGWIISVALHEFGHALMAYWGGDDSVVDKGYLTLNPLKYTHPFLSIVLPVVFLIMGGIGFPGGAVYINTRALRNNFIRSLTSAAGPVATILCAVLLMLPFIFGWYNSELILMHVEFWAGFGLLAFLQVTALAINLLPIPGLDGFGIVEPFLSPEIMNVANAIRPFGFFILYALLFIDTPIRGLFWDEIWNVAIAIDPALAWLASQGLDLFRLW